MHLDNSPAEVLTQLLVDIGQGSETLTADWACHVSKEPTTPDKVITCYNTAPFMQGRFAKGGQVQQKFGVQIRLRSPTDPVGWAKASTIQKALTEPAVSSVYDKVVTVGAHTYLVHSVSVISGPLSIGDESPTSTRRLFTINVAIPLRQLT